MNPQHCDSRLIILLHEVCLSVMSVDCNHTVQQKVEIGNERIGWCLGYLQVEAHPNRRIL